MPQATLAGLLHDLGDVCTRLRSSEQQREGWNQLRKVLETFQPALVEPATRRGQLGALYILRAFVGDVSYNVLNGDCRRHDPVEGTIAPGFGTMTARICEFIECALLGSGEDDLLARLGGAVREFYAVIAAIDERTTRETRTEDVEGA